MSKELRLLNFLCVIAAIVFFAFAVINLLTSGTVISTDNLFITMVCLVMALIFAVNPLLYLKSEGKLPLPGLKGTTVAATATNQLPGTKTPPLLDAKGRAMPPDVRAIVSKLGTQTKEAS
jgi:hypothetical protein